MWNPYIPAYVLLASMIPVSKGQTSEEGSVSRWRSKDVDVNIWKPLPF